MAPTLQTLGIDRMRVEERIGLARISHNPVASGS